MSTPGKKKREKKGAPDYYKRLLLGLGLIVFGLSFIVGPEEYLALFPLMRERTYIKIPLWIPGVGFIGLGIATILICLRDDARFKK